jgi:SAM-dependent methyltransferase
MTAEIRTYGSGVKVTPRVVMPHAYTGRSRTDKLRAFSRINPRLVPHLARTLLRGRSTATVEAFHAHCKETGFDFTYDGVSSNIPFIAPLLTAFAAKSGGDTIRYLEIGAFEGRNLAFLDWLLPGRLDVVAIDPWFNDAFNPDASYHAIEARFHRNMKLTRFKGLETRRSFSGSELPLLRAAGDHFDLIYVDGSHAALEVLIDLSYCASLLTPGGMMILDDYWHDISDIGGPGVKQAVDQFLRIFGRYFTVDAVYRQVVLTKTDEIPR